jgi:mono/diheme cytochrome c family protein
MSVESQKTLPPAGEETEPIADRTPVPVLLIGLFAVLFFLGLYILNNEAGGFSPHVYEPFGSLDDLVARNKETHPTDPLINTGKIVFTTVCAACHMPDGMGNPAVGAPPLVGSDWVNAEGPNRIIRIVLNGFTGPVEVSGKQYGTGTMTPFKDVFTDEQIAGVLSFVRQEWGNKGSRVTPQQVAAIRKETADKMGPWTAPDLQSIPPK